MLTRRDHLIRDQMVEFPDLELAPLEQILGTPLPSRGMDEEGAMKDNGPSSSTCFIPDPFLRIPSEQEPCPWMADGGPSG